jgi:hypothetical protein
MSKKWYEKVMKVEHWGELSKMILILVFIFALVFAIKNCKNSDEFVNEKIKRSSNLQKLDTICNDVGKKGNIEFKGKSVSTKHRDVVRYNYSSYSSQSIFFANTYFEENGWKKSSKLSTKTSIEFEKDGVYVEIIEQSESFSSNYFYSIRCGN